MQLLQVKEYNNIQIQNYNKRVSEWKDISTPYPCYAFYGFRFPDNTLRKNGYVVSYNGSDKYYKNKKLANEYIQSIIYEKLDDIIINNN